MKYYGDIFIALAVASFVIYCIIAYKIDAKKIKKLASEIKVGDIYRHSIYSGNPFKGMVHFDVEITELKNDWVAYRWSDGNISYREKTDFIEYPFRKVEHKNSIEPTK